MTHVQCSRKDQVSALIAIAQLLLANLLDASSAQGDNQKNATGSIAFFNN